MLLEDMETGELMDVSSDFARREYRTRMQDHIAKMKSETQGAGADYLTLNTSQPLDLALREYLIFRQRRR